jgi:hypothetical protein
MSFPQDEVIMKLFIDNAKSYIQLSTGALVFSITFIEKVLQKVPPIKPDLFLMSSQSRNVLFLPKLKCPVFTFEPPC